MNFTGDQVAIIGSLFTIIPILLVALLLRWVRIIRVNSEIQIEQNKEIIALLKELNMNNEGKWSLLLQLQGQVNSIKERQKYGNQLRSIGYNSFSFRNSYSSKWCNYFTNFNYFYWVWNKSIIKEQKKSKRVRLAQ